MNEAVCLFCKKTFMLRWSSHKKHFCTGKCSSDYRKQQGNERRKQQFLEGKLKHRCRVYKFLVERDGNRCQICSLPGVWNEKSLRLWVDHTDGNATNNNPSNFRLVCPNCESQSDTSRGRNFGKGRRSRGLAPYG